MEACLFRDLKNMHYKTGFLKLDYQAKTEFREVFQYMSYYSAACLCLPYEHSVFSRVYRFLVIFTSMFF